MMLLSMLRDWTYASGRELTMDDNKEFEMLQFKIWYQISEKDPSKPLPYARIDKIQDL
jgi:hypothetical protein